MKLLVDMNLSPRWAKMLANSGIESVHWSSVGAANAPDSEIMAYAGANGYVVLTHDLDFSAILAPRTEKSQASYRFVPTISASTRSGSKSSPRCGK